MLGLRVSHWFSPTPTIHRRRMVKTGGQQGFTLIEILLFLAITGLLFLIGFFGTGAQVRQVRFNDSMRGLHSYLQKQYNLVATGANPRQVNATCTGGGTLGTPPTFGTGAATAGDTAGDAGDCVLLGRLVKFDPGTSNMTAYYVVGQRVSTEQLTGNDMTDLANSGPTLSPQAAEPYQINWGATFYQPSSGVASNQTQAFAYLRSPSTGRIITFAFSGAAVTATTQPGNDSGFRSAVTSANLAKRTGYCFRDADGRNAILKLAYSQRSDTLDLTFKSFDPLTDCVRSKP